MARARVDCCRQGLKCSRRAPGYFTLIGDKAPPAARYIEATLLSSHRKRWSLLVFERKPIHIGRIFHPGRSRGFCPVRATGGSLPCGRYLLAPLTGTKKEARALRYSELSLHQHFIPRWTTHPYILYQVCTTRGTAVGDRSRAAVHIQLLQVED